MGKPISNRLVLTSLALMVALTDGRTILSTHKSINSLRAPGLNAHKIYVSRAVPSTQNNAPAMAVAHDAPAKADDEKSPETNGTGRSLEGVKEKLATVKEKAVTLYKKLRGGGEGGGGEDAAAAAATLQDVDALLLMDFLQAPSEDMSEKMQELFKMIKGVAPNMSANDIKEIFAKAFEKLKKLAGGGGGDAAPAESPQDEESIQSGRSMNDAIQRAQEAITKAKEYGAEMIKKLTGATEAPAEAAHAGRQFLHVAVSDHLSAPGQHGQASSFQSGISNRAAPAKNEEDAAELTTETPDNVAESSDGPTSEQTDVEPAGDVRASDQTATEPVGDASTSEQTAVEPEGDVRASDQTATEPVGDASTSEQSPTDTTGDAATSEQAPTEPVGDVRAADQTGTELGEDSTTSEQTAVEPEGDVRASDQTATEPVEDAATSEQSPTDTTGDATASDQTPTELGEETTTSEQTATELEGDVRAAVQTATEPSDADKVDDKAESKDKSKSKKKKPKNKSDEGLLEIDSKKITSMVDKAAKKALQGKFIRNAVAAAASASELEEADQDVNTQTGFRNARFITVDYKEMGRMAGKMVKEAKKTASKAKDEAGRLSDTATKEGSKFMGKYGPEMPALPSLPSLPIIGDDEDSEEAPKREASDRNARFTEGLKAVGRMAGKAVKEGSKMAGKATKEASKLAEKGTKMMGQDGEDEESDNQKREASERNVRFIDTMGKMAGKAMKQGSKMAGKATKEASKLAEKGTKMLGPDGDDEDEESGNQKREASERNARFIDTMGKMAGKAMKEGTKMAGKATKEASKLAEKGTKMMGQGGEDEESDNQKREASERNARFIETMGKMAGKAMKEGGKLAGKATKEGSKLAEKAAKEGSKQLGLDGDDEESNNKKREASERNARFIEAVGRMAGKAMKEGGKLAGKATKEGSKLAEKAAKEGSKQLGLDDGDDGTRPSDDRKRHVVNARFIDAGTLGKHTGKVVKGGIKVAPKAYKESSTFVKAAASAKTAFEESNDQSGNQNGETVERNARFINFDAADAGKHTGKIVKTGVKIAPQVFKESTKLAQSAADAKTAQEPEKEVDDGDTEPAPIKLKSKAKGRTLDFGGMFTSLKTTLSDLKAKYVGGGGGGEEAKADAKSVQTDAEIGQFSNSDKGGAPAQNGEEQSEGKVAFPNVDPYGLISSVKEKVSSLTSQWTGNGEGAADATNSKNTVPPIGQVSQDGSMLAPAMSAAGEVQGNIDFAQDSANEKQSSITKRFLEGPMYVLGKATGALVGAKSKKVAPTEEPAPATRSAAASENIECPAGDLMDSVKQCAKKYLGGLSSYLFPNGDGAR